MSLTSQATTELQKWISKQLRQGISQGKLYFFLLEKGFSQDVASLMLGGYQPAVKTAIIEQCPDKANMPNTDWFKTLSHFYSFANIPLTKRHNSSRAAIEDAQMYVLSDVIPLKLCEQLIIRSKRFFSPSQVIGNRYNQKNSGRTSSTALVRDIAPDADQKIQSAVGQMMGIDPKYCEPLQIQHYKEGQEYQVHADWFDSSHAGYEENVKDQGQRTWTCLIYLNQNFQGGQTHFPELKLKINPQVGKACVWNNLTLTGNVNKSTYHCGTPVTRGNKYILTAWFRAIPNA